jgi:hypothetical protein
MITDFNSFPEYYLYHGTSDKNLDKMFENGINSPSYWTNIKEMAEYYSIEVIEDIGGEPIIIKKPFSKFDQSKFEIDYPSLEEPITMVLGKSGKKIWEKWEKSDQTWKDCLNICGCIIYNDNIRISENDIE